MKKTKPRAAKVADNPKQSAAFITKARELGADRDGAGADLLMGRLAKMKPAPRPQKKKSAPKRKASP